MGLGMRAGVTAGVLLACLALPPVAGAVLQGTAEVRLHEEPGGPLDVTDGIAIGAGPEITPGDGSAIGALLLPGESIDLGGFAIALAVEEGASDGATGYPPGTRFTFGALDFGDPQLGIAGVSLALDNATLDPAAVAFTRDSVTLFVDTLAIGEIPGAVDVAVVTLLLDVQDLPEADAAFAGPLALAALLRLRRRPR